MFPFLTQPAVAAACYVPKEKDSASALFDGTDNALSRLASLGNRRRFTIAGCIMRGKLGAYQAVFGTQTDNNNNVFVRFQDTDELQFALTQGSAQVGYRMTTAKYRDTAPLLFVASCDTTKGPGNSPMRLSVNGPNTPCTILDPALNYDTHMNVVGTQYVGRHSWSATGFLDALIPNLIVVDGADLDWSVFFEQNIHGVWVWKPKADIYAAIAAAGGWGTNGFHLDFSDPLQPGKDVSGQGNHFTASGFDAAGKDTVVSTPTNVYATFNPLALRSTNGLLRGNTEAGAGGYESIVLTSIPLPDTGRWEAEIEVLSTYAAMPGIGIAPVTADVMGNTALGGAGNGMSWNNNGNLVREGVTVLSGLGPHAVGDKVRVVFDGSTRQVWMRRLSGGWIGGGDPVAGTGGLAAPTGSRLMFAVSCDVAARVRLNTSFIPTSGCRPLCTDNLPEPDIKDPAEALAQASAIGANILAVLDAGVSHWNTDGWVEIIKRVEASEDWRVRFSDDPGNAWATNNANAEGAAAPLVAGGAYIGHRLRVGVRYGVWTAEVAHVTGTATTVTHGLSTARNVVIATRVSLGGGDRYVRHPDMAAGVLGKLNANTQPVADGTLTAFGASSFQIAAAAPSGTYRVLVLAHRAGWLEIGSYKGNGSADGAFDPMGIAPLWQMIKRLDTSGAWMQADRAHAPVNPMTRHFDLDKPNSEITASYDLDMVVGGTKYRTAGYSSNDTGGTYLRVAIGRPGGGVCVAPANAR